MLKGWVNKRAAEAWEDEALSKVQADQLLERAAMDPYPSGTVPDGVLLLTMAVDVQDTWLEVSVIGFGRGDEQWLVWHQKIEGDPAQDEVWQQVDSIRELQWPRASGGTMKVRACGVDTGGHFTGEAYEYCRLRARDGVSALKGSSNRGAQTISRGRVLDVNHKGKLIKNGVTLYLVGTHDLKRTIYSRLKNPATTGPGVIHWGQNASYEYLQGLTCERLVPRYVKGFQVLEWQKKSGDRNEPLDLNVYCLAVLELVRRRYNRQTFWDQLEMSLSQAPTSPKVERRRGTWLS